MFQKTQKSRLPPIRNRKFYSAKNPQFQISRQIHPSFAAASYLVNNTISAL